MQIREAQIGSSLNPITVETSADAEGSYMKLERWNTTDECVDQIRLRNDDLIDLIELAKLIGWEV